MATVTQDALPHVESAIRFIVDKSTSFSTLRDFVRGKQPLVFATDKFRSAFGSIFRAFAINYCQLILDIISDHIIIEDVLLKGGDERVRNALQNVLAKNNLQSIANRIHNEALWVGQAALIVWPGPDGFPRFYPNAGDQIFFSYSEDEPLVPSAAVKIWQIDDKTAGITVYLPDRIEKYTIAISAGWPNINTLEPRGSDWVVRNPYGEVPVFPFYNALDATGGFRSEIADIVSLQNALNKVWMDLLVAMEFQAVPLRWVAGIDIEIDPETGKPIPPFTQMTDRIWAIPYEGAKLGQFEAADLSPFTNVAAGIVQHIAAISHVPVHYLIPPTAIWPSGESLWASMQGFERHINTKQSDFSASWRNAFLFALRILGHRSKDLDLEIRWKPVAPVREVERLSALLLKNRAGIPKYQIMREMGYSEDEIEGFLQVLEAQMADETQGNEGPRIPEGEFLREMPREVRPFVAKDSE